MKTSELTDQALDWAVAKTLGYFETKSRNGLNVGLLDHGSIWAAPHPNAWRKSDYKRFQPSTDWAQGGPLMDQAEIDTYLYERGSPFGWVAEITGTKFKGNGPTRLIAAMRCLVASRLGNEVEIPEDLG